MGRPLYTDNDTHSVTPESTSASTSTSTVPESSASSAQPQTLGYGAGANTGAGVTRPKTQEELEADARYEELMEEEYAKRDGAPNHTQPLNIGINAAAQTAKVGDEGQRLCAVEPRHSRDKAQHALHVVRALLALDGREVAVLHLFRNVVDHGRFGQFAQ
ncbi:hypothetical protein CFIMG_007642RA00001 [Ceratocystis fimbriata CBS 114723]|uniref:Uncharacterized protein n=1 Tax=Ceratocystis fimbriata CBS 114723 TaxID=1035309 RepID=A0A2C5XBD3_9PEZI|nr:hypothetical protein CFIMG_007642RA00001 [Ceratocystis fimbriata CBS 114723]